MTATRTKVAPGLLRVFLSSTFRDMQEEREIIVQRVFPAWRRQCRERGVACAEIDLRWGITEDQCNRGEIVPICLREIEHSNLFVCVLGARYGTHLRDLPGTASLLGRLPWLGEHLHCSVTEIEILHGVLGRNPQCADALFYFRAESIESEAEDPQVALKARIRSAGLPVKVFSSPSELGEHLTADLSVTLDQFAPVSNDASMPARTQLAHEYFASVQSQPFVGRLDELARLQRFLQSGGKPLLIMGPAGVGKTALIARWIVENCNHGQCAISARRWWKWGSGKPAQAPCVVYFPAAEQHGYRLSELLRSVLSRLPFPQAALRSAGWNDQILRRQFAHRLHEAAVAGPVLLVLDGLDQLDARDLQYALAWLPETLPTNVRLVASAAGGPVVDAWRQRKWQTWELGPFQQNDVRNLTTAYLENLYGKSLEAQVADKMTKLPQLRHPGMARVVLDELRQIGSPGEVPARLDSLALCEDFPALYSKLLKRWEYACDASILDGPPGIVPQALALLLCSRTGLSQQECCDALGEQGSLPCVYLGALWSVLDSLLTNRAGVLAIASLELRQAIESRYLSHGRRRGFHERLTRLFSQSTDQRRRADELPWHLAILEQWDDLERLLSDAEFVAAAWPTHAAVLAGWWSQWELKTGRSRAPSLVRSLQANLPLAQLSVLARLLRPAVPVSQLVELSRRILALSDQAHPTAWTDANMFHASALLEAGALQEAAQICQGASEYCQQHSDPIGRAGALLQLGLIARRNHRLADARRHLAAARTLFQSAGSSQGQADASGNLGLVCYDCDSAREALRYIDEQRILCEQVGDLEGICCASGNRGQVLAKLRKFDAALKAQREAERLAQRLGDHVSVDSALHHQIEVLLELERYDSIIETAYNRIENADQHGLSHARQSSRYQLATILRELGKTNAADSLESEAARISDRCHARQEL